MENPIRTQSARQRQDADQALRRNESRSPRIVCRLTFPWQAYITISPLPLLSYFHTLGRNATRARQVLEGTSLYSTLQLWRSLGPVLRQIQRWQALESARCQEVISLDGCRSGEGRDAWAGEPRRSEVWLDLGNGLHMGNSEDSGDRKSSDKRGGCRLTVGY